jgi:tetratricopeptide (TPR) repeat protein
MLWESPVLLWCAAFVPSSLGAVSLDCLRENSAIVERLAESQVDQAQHVALDALAVGVSHLEPVCAGLLLNAAASTSLLSGKLDNARTLAEQSLTYLQQALPPDDPVYLRPLHLLANVYLVQGLTAKARETLCRIERINATSPQDRALFREINAAVLQREQKTKEAEMNYLAALVAISDAGKQNSAEAVAVQRSLAFLYLQENRYSDASSTVDAAIATLQRAKDAVPLDRIQLLNVRAAVSAYRGRWRDAEADLSNAVSLARRQAHLDSVVLEPLVTNYAQVLCKLHRKDARSVKAWAVALRSETAASRQTIDVTQLSAPRVAGRCPF